MVRAEIDHDTYNDIAVDVARRLTAARAAAFGTAAGRDRPREQLFGDRNRVGLGVALEWEAMGSRHITPELEARATALGFELEHVGLTLGTVIHGIDLHEPLTPALVDFVRAVLLERKVVFFRGQNLTEDEQVALGRSFGDLDAFPFGPPGENPYILEIRHGRRRPGSENGWHTDVTWMERPSMGSIAQLVVAPSAGGDTLFADSHAAYHGLPDHLKERLRYVEGMNDYGGFVPTGPSGLDEELVEDIKAQIPFGVSHPVLRTHPETGKTALYLHGGFLRHDSLYDIRTGETLADSAEIVDFLLDQHPRPEYQCRFRWEAGSIAFWDNRAVQHYASSDYYPEVRVLRRVTVAGDKPYFDPSAAGS